MECGQLGGNELWGLLYGASGGEGTAYQLQYAWETVCYVIWGKASAKGGQKVVEAAPEELTEKYQNIFRQIDMEIGGKPE